MIILSKEQILKLHAGLICATGGSVGIRDEGMLDLALNNPFQSFGGKELYPSIQAKAVCFAMLLWSIWKKMKLWNAQFVIRKKTAKPDA